MNRISTLACPLLITFGFVWISGCVSVNLGSQKVAKSDGVKFEAPGVPFRPLESTADGSWKNKDTGSTIAYQSGCGEAADLPLEALADDLLAGLEDKREVAKSKRPFDGRESLDIEVEGRLDGVVTRNRALVYKKNRCSYTLTYVSLPQFADRDRAQFEKFILSFAAP